MIGLRKITDVQILLKVVCTGESQRWYVPMIYILRPSRTCHGGPTEGDARLAYATAPQGMDSQLQVATLSTLNAEAGRRVGAIAESIQVDFGGRDEGIWKDARA